MPDPNISVRTGREQRISIFMLWQIIHEFQFRERRYGETSEDIS
ncbi:MAG: undecaprenyl diphosphate synthase family protein [Bacteroidales bacterium]|nr:undecaprenyl diphosphate synthase family protein [Bacteroidales bacterium]